MTGYLRMILIAVMAIIAGLGSVYVLNMKHDNKIEEKMEEVIEKQTGLDIDLTPSSTEK